MDNLELDSSIYPTSEMLAYVPSPEEICKGSREDTVRFLFGNTELTDFEREKITEFRSVSSIEASDEDILRLLLSNRCNMTKTRRSLEVTLRWREENITNSNPSLYERALPLLNSGAIYVFGRDKKHRPILMLNLGNFNIDRHTAEEYTSVACFYLELIISHMLVPGKIENWNILMDLDNRSLTKLPIGQLKKIIEVLQNNYSCRMANTFIVNAPSSLKFVWKMLSNFMDKDTVEKIQIFSDSQAPEILEVIDSSQLQRKYGGTAPDIGNYWPPRVPMPEDNEASPLQIGYYRNLKVPPTVHYSEMIMNFMTDETS